MDFSMIPWQALGVATSGWALAGGGVWLFFTGRVIPRSTHEDALHDRDQWRAESRIKDAQIAEKDAQLRHMAEVGKLSESILLAVRNAQGGSVS